MSFWFALLPALARPRGCQLEMTNSLPFSLSRDDGGPVWIESTIVANGEADAGGGVSIRHAGSGSGGHPVSLVDVVLTDNTARIGAGTRCSHIATTRTSLILLLSPSRSSLESHPRDRSALEGQHEPGQLHPGDQRCLRGRRWRFHSSPTMPRHRGVDGRLSRCWEHRYVFFFSCCFFFVHRITIFRLLPCHYQPWTRAADCTSRRSLTLSLNQQRCSTTALHPALA